MEFCARIKYSVARYPPSESIPSIFIFSYTAVKSKVILLTALVFSVIFSSASYAEWTKRLMQVLRGLEVKRFLLSILFSVAVYSHAMADDNAKANKLFVEAIKLINEAGTEVWLKGLEKQDDALLKFKFIIHAYPSSDLAVKLLSGQKIGNYSLNGLKKTIEVHQRKLSSRCSEDGHHYSYPELFSCLIGVSLSLVKFGVDLGKPDKYHHAFALGIALAQTRSGYLDKALETLKLVIGRSFTERTGLSPGLIPMKLFGDSFPFSYRQLEWREEKKEKDSPSDCIPRPSKIFQYKNISGGWSIFDEQILVLWDRISVENVLGLIIRGYLKRGNINRAVDITKFFEPETRLRHLVYIGMEGRKQKFYNEKPLQSVWKEIFVLLELLSDKEKERQYDNLVYHLARCGDIERAEYFLGRIKGQENKIRAEAYIITAKIIRDGLSRSKNLLAGLSKKLRNKVLSNVKRRQMVKGNVSEAVKAIFLNEKDYYYNYEDTVRALLKQGNIEGALKIMAYTKSSNGEELVYRELALLRANAGDIEAALDVYKKIPRAWGSNFNYQFFEAVFKAGKVIQFKDRLMPILQGALRTLLKDAPSSNPSTLNPEYQAKDVIQIANYLRALNETQLAKNILGKVLKLIVKSDYGSEYKSLEEAKKQWGPGNEKRATEMFAGERAYWRIIAYEDIAKHAEKWGMIEIARAAIRLALKDVRIIPRKFRPLISGDPLNEKKQRGSYCLILARLAILQTKIGQQEKALKNFGLAFNTVPSCEYSEPDLKMRKRILLAMTETGHIGKALSYIKFMSSIKFKEERGHPINHDIAERIYLTVFLKAAVGRFREAIELARRWEEKMGGRSPGLGLFDLIAIEFLKVDRKNDAASVFLEALGPLSGRWYFKFRFRQSIGLLTIFPHEN